MDINDILTEIEYTKERSAKELFEWFTKKQDELGAWSQEHSGVETLRKIKHRELSKGLPDKFSHELTPFAYYAKAYYGDKPSVRFIPCCGSEQYDGIIFEDKITTYFEAVNAIDGGIWALQKELLIARGHSPWEYNILGVQGNKTKRKRSVGDIITDDEALSGIKLVDKVKKRVKKATLAKCAKSVKPELPYGQNNTILMVTFDDTGIGPRFNKNRWNDFISFKQNEIDPIKHNFKKIILFGWLDKEFIE